VHGLTQAQLLKLDLLVHGAAISRRAGEVLRDLTVDGRLSPADYASTSGVILRLSGREWVNVPIETFNPNFVSESPFILDHHDEGFVICGPKSSVEAEFWPLPHYTGHSGPSGESLNKYVFTHADRVRLSPTVGCAFECTFCNVPYDEAYGGVKALDVMIESLRAAFADPVQPARHLLVSGGTPGPSHVQILQEVYYRVLEEFAPAGVDIMMVPVGGLFDLDELKRLGVNDLSVNLELWDEKLAATAMRQKFRQGRQYYLDFFESAAAVLGGNHVRSMLMVGIEPIESTLEAVEAIAQRGCVPVLSPFRPDPVTPLATMAPPTVDLLRETYLRAEEITNKYGVVLGPTCAPCTHNTLTFAGEAHFTDFPRLERGAS
jgi:Radical SAM superfamily